MATDFYGRNDMDMVSFLVSDSFMSFVCSLDF